MGYIDVMILKWILQSVISSEDTNWIELALYGAKFWAFLYTVVKLRVVALGSLAVIVLAIGTMVRGFKPGRGRYTFKGDSNP
jgi:hypothetical protein